MGQMLPMPVKKFLLQYQFTHGKPNTLVQIADASGLFLIAKRLDDGHKFLNVVGKKDINKQILYNLQKREAV